MHGLLSGPREAGLEPIGLPDVNSSEQPNLWRLLDETLAEVYETIDPPEIGSALH
jgi:hypothetical protein